MPGCDQDGTLQHELIHCIKNDSMGTKLVSCLQHYLPGLQPEDVLRLDHGEVDDDLSLPMTLLSAIVLNHIWKERELNSSIRN